ncbi:5'-nucleotidase C-terminal domain-containing protein [Clostridium sp.]|uniref:5'-nucleotidase C-terminal domain-containing protein n=1 Tax=Clostridium sp. TaxID=1506 RepID=UPI001EC4F806|nr:5'-nucleotidase C-terminal domain-containing protein [Clostridium sp.]MBS5884840.1 5'-nucleotidase C-terminal domain-containing protein [Clostridium sp.]MDU7243126.1 5'-nucleotidase C-terminal domain-containing protein [Clostridium sp.]
MRIKGNLKKFLASVVALTFIIGNLPMNLVKAAAEELSTETVQILATTDLHGRFVPYEYARATRSDGGLTQIATLVEQERAKNANTVLVDNGDNIQGNYNHLFLNDEKNPMMLAVKEIGYDSFSLGNHEFNFGMDKLFQITNQIKDNVKVLCANLYKGDERVFDAYTIKKLPNGVKVATIGVVTPHIDKWDGPNLVGYTPKNPTEEVAKVIQEIKAAGGADVYVVTSHMGFNNEYGKGDSAKELAEANPDVDVIVMGHSHEAFAEKTAGNAILIQPANNAGSLGKVELKLEKSNDGYVVKEKKGTLLKTTGVAENEKLALNLKSYDERAKSDASIVIGKLEGPSLADKNEIADIPESLVRDQGITDLVNEVQIYNSKNHLESQGIDVDSGYMVSAAALFDAGSNMQTGDIKKSDISNIYKYDNKLYTIKTNGKQLKRFMEWTASIYNTFNAGDLTVSLNPDIRLYQYDMFDGISYEINISKPAGSRIENVKFEKDGKVVEDTDVVYLSVNNYRYDSVLNASNNPVFEPGTHEKVYDTNNDKISDMRDLITDYIVKVKGGKISRNIDNNWKLTGVNYDEKLREEVVKLVNDGVLSIPVSDDGRTPNVKSLTINDVLVAKNLKRVELVSFNDLHGNVQESGKNVGIAKLASAIKERTSLNGFSNYEAIPLSAGDLYQGTAISNLTKGAPVNEFLKDINIPASSVGNHEFDWGKELIPTWAKAGNFDFLAANIIDKKTGKPVEWAKPYKIIEVDGIKIGLIGVTTPETAYKTTPANVADLTFEDPSISVQKYADKLRKEDKVNAVVVLSHLGATTDKDGKPVGEAVDLANKIKNVDAIIASHDHQFTNVEANGIKIIEAGYNGRALSVLTFDFDNTGKLVSLGAKLDELYSRSANIIPDETSAEIVKKYEAELKPILSEKVADLDKDLGHDRNEGLTPLGTVVSETMRKITGVDIAITNGGGVRAPLSAGVLTIGDLYTILPFDNTLVTMELKGSDVKAAIEHGIMPANFGWGQFSGIKVWYDKDAPAGERITSIRLADGTPLDMDKYYTVVVNDFMATGGDGYDFTNARNMKDTMLVMRDEISNYWKKNGVDTDIENLLIAGVDDTKEPANPGENPGGNNNGEEGSNNNGQEGSNNQGNLPTTGGQNPINLLVFAILISGVGYVMFRKKTEEKAS